MIRSLLVFLFLSPPALAQLSRAEFDHVLQVFGKAVQATVVESRGRLVINQQGNPEMETFWWQLENAHASYTGHFESDGTLALNIFVFGGYARQPGMTADGLAWVLCHELGHGLGGTPHKHGTTPPFSSVEGQADYYSTRTCLRQIIPSLPKVAINSAPTLYTQSLCDQSFPQGSERQLCYRQFHYLEQHRARINEQLPSTQSIVKFETPELHSVTEVNTQPYFYPSHQCRLDTLVAGVLNRERPFCWWAP